MSSSTAERADRQAWDREYAEIHAYTTSYRDDEDRGIQFLRGYLHGLGETIEGPLLECACGRGRNALPLAAEGRRVVGLDHALQALSQFRQRAEKESLAGAVALQHDLRQPLPIASRSMATVLDITAVDNLVEPEARRQYGQEVARVLRPGGIAVVVTFDVDDGYYARFRPVGEVPGPGVVEDPNTGIRNQLFRGPDLDAVFAPPLRRVAANRFDFIDEAAQQRWTRRFLLRVYRKD